MWHFLPSAIIFLLPKLAENLELIPALPVLTANTSACRAWAWGLCCPTNETIKYWFRHYCLEQWVPLIGTLLDWRSHTQLCAAPLLPLGRTGESGSDFKTLNDQELFLYYWKLHALYLEIYMGFWWFLYGALWDMADQGLAFLSIRVMSSPWLGMGYC